MTKYPSIEQFRNVKRNVEHKTQCIGKDAAGDWIMNRLAKLPKLRFEGLVKIHGTNAGIRIEGDKITCQSRENEITPEKDNAGFARFVSNLPVDAIERLKSFGDNIVIFGEWAGKGIQNKVAVCQLEKFFTVFAVRPIADEDGGWFDIEMLDFSELNKYGIFNIYQFGKEIVEVDFESPAESINKINELSLAVEKECPVAKFFGVSGIGEGRVWKCIEKGFESSRFLFKVKGSEHSASRVTKLANVNIEKMKNIESFVDKHVNEARLEQSYQWLAENNKEQTEKSTGDFIKWIFNDILKEEKDELLGSGLTEKDLGGAVAKRAKNWFFAKINK